MAYNPEDFPYNISYLKIGDKNSDLIINEIIDILLNNFKSKFKSIIEKNLNYENLGDIASLSFSEKINYIIFFHQKNEDNNVIKEDYDKITCKEISDIIKDNLPSRIEVYEKLKKDFRYNIWLSKKFLEPKTSYYNEDDTEEEKEKYYYNIGDKKQIETWEDLSRILELINNQNITPSVYLFNSILGKLSDLTPIKVNFFYEIRKLFFNKIFKNIIPNAKTFQIILYYKNLQFFSIQEIMNLIDLVQIHSDFQFDYITEERSEEFSEKFKMTLGDIKEELKNRELKRRASKK